MFRSIKGTVSEHKKAFPCGLASKGPPPTHTPQSAGYRGHVPSHVLAAVELAGVKAHDGLRRAEGQQVRPPSAAPTAQMLGDTESPSHRIQMYSCVHGPDRTRSTKSGLARRCW